MPTPTKTDPRKCRLVIYHGDGQELPAVIMAYRKHDPRGHWYVDVTVFSFGGTYVREKLPLFDALQGEASDVERWCEWPECEELPAYRGDFQVLDWGPPVPPAAEQAEPGNGDAAPEGETAGSAPEGEIIDGSFEVVNPPAEGAANPAPEPIASEDLPL